MITYSSPHEVLLNLSFFQGRDTVTYVSRENNQEAFTITVDRFKSMLAELINSVSHEEAEHLYLRLLLANRYKQTIIDRGRFLQNDIVLKNYLVNIKGGYDSHLAFEKRKVILYFKYRRLSAVHLLAIIDDWNFKHKIDFNHIMIPKTVANQGLIFEALRLDFRSDQVKTIYYGPIEEDNIQPTNIRLKIIDVINQLIKQS